MKNQPKKPKKQKKTDRCEQAGTPNGILDITPDDKKENSLVLFISERFKAVLDFTIEMNTIKNIVVYRSTEYSYQDTQLKAKLITAFNASNNLFGYVDLKKWLAEEFPVNAGPDETGPDKLSISIDNSQTVALIITKLNDVLFSSPPELPVRRKSLTILAAAAALEAVEATPGCKRNHTGEEPFKCRHCDYETKHNGTFRRHERTHTDEKPFQCPYCEREFSFLHNLRRHIKKMHPKETTNSATTPITEPTNKSKKRSRSDEIFRPQESNKKQHHSDLD